MASTWGSSTWSSNSWGDVNNIISVTGIGASASLGNETTQANADVIPTGIAMTASQGGEEEIVIATTGDPTGILISANLGTADAGPDAMVTGLSTASMSLGTVDAFNLEGWGRQQWNTFAWGITGSLLTTGIAATANLGSIASITADANVIPTGIAMTASQGDESIEISFEIELTGIAATVNVGTADAGPDAMLTGIGATAALGTLDAFNQTGWGRQGWNVNAWGVEGQFASGNVNGIAMSANVGTLAATGDGSVVPTGISITAAEGDVDPGPDANITGIGFSGTLAVGTVVAGSADVTVTGTGFAAGLGLGTLFAESLIDVTGIAMTANLGSVTTKGFATVSLTGIGLTMNLNSVNSLVWNEVNTGSAPLDPPGWVEVPTRAA